MIQQFAIRPAGGGTGGATLSLKISAGTLSANRTDVTFSNSNGVSFGLNPAGVVTATVATNYQSQGAYLTTAMASNRGSDFVQATAAFAGTNASGTINSTGISVSVAAQSVNSVKFSAGTLTSNRTDITFSNSNGVSFGLETNGVITATVATNYQSQGAYLTTAALSQDSSKYAGTAFATTTSAGTAIAGTLNTSGLTLGVPPFLTTAMQSNAGTITAINVSAGTTSTNASNFTFSNANNVSFGLGTGASSQNITASIATTYAGTGFTTTTTAGTAIVGTLNTSGLSMGVPAFLTTAEASRKPLSYFANVPFLLGGQTTFAQSNSFYVLPITIPEKISISYLRLLATGSLTSTTIGTTAVNNATGASTAFSKTMAFNAILYTVGTGASSQSLQHVYSTSAGLTWAVSVSQASTSNATNQSISQKMTFPILGFTTSTESASYTTGATNGPIVTSVWALFSGNRFLDIPFITSLSAGNYWLALNRISGTVGGKNMDYALSTYGQTQTNLTWGNLDDFGAASNGALFFGLGTWTTNVASTTSSIAFSDVGQTTSFIVPAVQFINQA